MKTATSRASFDIAASGRRLWPWRRAKDVLARHLVAWGGVSVIVALVLIFAYLLYVTLPLFRPAQVRPAGDYALPGGAAGTLFLAVEEQQQVGVRITDDGVLYFFRVADGTPMERHPLPLPEGVQITAAAEAAPATGVVALGLSNGEVLVVRHAYDETFPEDRLTVVPRLEYPLGEPRVVLDETGQAITALTVQDNPEEATLVGLTAAGRLELVTFTKEVSFLTEEVTLERSAANVPTRLTGIQRLLLNKQQQSLYALAADGRLEYFDVTDKQAPRRVQEVRLVPRDAAVTSLRFLTGGISLLVGDSRGTISQWFPVRQPGGGEALTFVRSFHEHRGPVLAIGTEPGRKGFASGDGDGRVALCHSTAERTLWRGRVLDGPVAAIAMAPRNDGMLVAGVDGRARHLQVHNEHPEVSWKALWGKVWYESYEEPAWVWQSSSASQDFEPKLSLTPISFGTLKAAFYAMLIAMPLAIFGAIYTAYFMHPDMRRAVKPTIELMEALPTVILGFLAGLWLAPMAEAYLPGVFLLLLLMPVAVVAASYLWARLPLGLRTALPEGWAAALLLPVVGGVIWLSFALSHPVEQWLFAGDTRLWLTGHGIGFDQRNALVVGLAMGFAVIPTIFSISEDAIFSVPRHLSHGSLALGATPWQTLVRVVLLTASPGIFSAVMIGFGRAVGETMIVLMATGNTPVMDWSIFEGMRTLSANIAVEMPESEVASTHYRVLFLAGLVLFLFTFVVNTVAEVVRQRLRGRYSSL